MKTTNLTGILLLFLCTIGVTACEKEEDMIWDFAPIVLSISVQDAQGNDLLNPATEGSIAKLGIKAIYKDKIYHNEEAARTRAYLAQFRGLQSQKSESGKYYLTFGEFNGDDTFKNEEVIIEWHDGTRDVISFSNSLTWKSTNKPVINRKFYLNGTETKSNVFTFTKEPAHPEVSSDIRYAIADWRYAVNADKKEAIESDLKNNPPFPIGGFYKFSFPDKLMKINTTVTYTIENTSGSLLESGSFTVEDLATFGNMPESSAAYKLLPPDDQIYFYMKWKLDTDVKEQTYDIYAVRNSAIGEYYMRLWMYEDLTGYYQTKYPDAGVKGVARIHIIRISNSLKKD